MFLVEVLGFSPAKQANGYSNSGNVIKLME
jgi:hypothetical protein